MSTTSIGAGPADRPSRVLERRPLEVLVFALFLLGAFVSLVFAVAFPMSDQAPVELGAVLAVVALGMAAVTLRWGARLGGPLILAEVVISVLLNGVVMSQSHTRVGMLLNAVAYAGLVLYIATFFPGVTRAVVALIVATFAAGVLISGVDGMVAAWAVLSISIAMLGEAMQRISHMVRGHMHTDPLTGALNRNGLDVAAARELARARRRDHPVTVVAIDLDGFKRINDEGGHAAGDRLLTEITAAWQQSLRGDDILARTGGDEFVVVLPDCSVEQAAGVLDRLAGAYPAPWSAGSTRWAPDEPLGSCLRRADEDLYAAKSARRDASALRAGAPAG